MRGCHDSRLHNVKFNHGIPIMQGSGGKLMTATESANATRRHKHGTSVCVDRLDELSISLAPAEMGKHSVRVDLLDTMI